MRLSVFATTVLWLTAAFAGAAPPAPGSAKLILAPRYFPGWQSQNVCYPCVIQESAGSYRMFYTGSASKQWNDSHWEEWATGYVTSVDTISWEFPQNYEQVFFAKEDTTTTPVTYGTRMNRNFLIYTETVNP